LELLFVEPFKGDSLTRQDLGLPANWNIVHRWIDESRFIGESGQKILDPLSVKNSEIVILDSYVKTPNKQFWNSFPKNYPSKLRHSIKTKVLKSYVQKCWFLWTRSQRGIAKKALRRAEGKERVPLKKILGGLKTKNSTSATENGVLMTDTIGSWVKKNFVAGPYGKAPLKNFRINPLMAAVQKDKVRPIMNLSSPKGRSFNDAVDILKFEKLKMSSPKLFGESIVKAGKGAVFSKSDIKDAFKLIPNAEDQWNLYGFEWLGKYFFDTSTVFGSRAAPAFFDSLPETIVNVVCCLEQIPKKFVHRQLDDVPIVTPKDSGMTERFTNRYKKICEELNVPLAENCPNHEKAFGCSTFGTVLGINFDSDLMEWSLSAAKERDLQEQIDKFLEMKSCSLKEVQRLHGKLANIAQTCDFLRNFKINLLTLLRKFEGDELTKKLINRELKDDLWVWKKVISQAREGIPLRNIFGEPPLFPKKFISDAAGAAFQWNNDGCKNVTVEGDRGVASVGYKNEKPTSIVILRWPHILMTGAKNRKGLYFGSMSSTLEAVGLLLPFLTIPNDLQGQHVLLEVDNTSVVYAWEKKHSKSDLELSLLIRCLIVIEAYLECKIYVKHVPRRSNYMSTLVDNLSRESTMVESVTLPLRCLEIKTVEGNLMKWLINPVLDWDLPIKLIDDIKSVLPQLS